MKKDPKVLTLGKPLGRWPNRESGTCPGWGKPGNRTGTLSKPKRCREPNLI